MKNRQRLEQLISLLERKQEPDTERVEVARAALTFLDSWVDLAKKMHKVRLTGAYERFGFSTFEEYAKSELGLNRYMVRNLLLSVRS